MSNENLSKLILKINEFPVLKAESSLYEVLNEMNKFKLGTICVIDDNEKLLGIFTDGDFRRIFLNIHKPLSAILIQDIIEYMKKNPISLKISEIKDKSFVLSLMKKNKIWDIPIIENDKLIGLIHLHDFLND